MSPLVTASGADLSRAHLIGAGGVGMSAIASLLLDRGATLSGSDSAASTSLQRLADRGMITAVGQRAENLDLQGGLPTAIVASTAIHPDNPELARARLRGIPVVSRAEALVALMAGKTGICVAGTHGKTSTSAMLAVALTHLGSQPSYAIGGVPAGLDSGAATGAGEVFVAESDESDGSLVAFSPYGAVITTIEPDHLDYHGTADAYAAVFDRFVARIDPTGFLVAGVDDPGVQALLARLPNRVRVITYGRSAEADVHIASIGVDGVHGRMSLEIEGYGTVPVSLAVPGQHMLSNAAAVVATGVGLGIDPHRLAAGLVAYHGVGRRFELRGQVDGIRVYDDYAHHPTEVAATLAAARSIAGDGRVVVVFQPHLYSRTAQFAAAFAGALGAADVAVVLDVYGAREEPQAGVTGRLIADAVDTATTQVRYVAELRDAAELTTGLLQPGDVVLTMGAGNVTTLGADIIGRWGARLSGPSGEGC